MYSPAATWPSVAHTIPPKISEIAIQIPLQMPASRSETSCASRWKKSRSTASIARMNAMTAAHAHHSTVMWDVKSVEEIGLLAGDHVPQRLERHVARDRRADLPVRL